MPDYICYINGTFVPYSQASLPVNDLTIMRGYGVFDALRTYHGKPYHLKAHLERLVKSAGLIGITLPWAVSDMEGIVRETLKRNTFEEATVRIQVTGGPSNDAITPLGKPGLMVIVSAVRIYPPEIYENGVKVITVRIDRPLPKAKTIDYTPAILALAQAREHKAIEALYVDRQGNVLEGTQSNFFGFKGNTLLTPHDGILEGITRRSVMELARAQFELVEQALPVAELAQLDEAFIASTSKEVMPVVQVDEQQIGNGKPGPRTLLLHRLFHEMAERTAE